MEALLVLTWRYLADGGRVPAVTLVAVRALDKDGAVAETLGKHLSPDVVEPDAPPWRRHGEALPLCPRSIRSYMIPLR